MWSINIKSQQNNLPCTSDTSSELMPDELLQRDDGVDVLEQVEVSEHRLVEVFEIWVYDLDIARELWVLRSDRFFRNIRGKLDIIFVML